MSVFLLAALVGCDSDCEDASRIKGEYAMWHTVLNAGQDGGATMDEAYPSYDVFVNGWSRWNITWSAAGGTVQASVTDVLEIQSDGEADEAVEAQLAGTLVSQDDNCNVFDMALSGTYETAADTTHTFNYASRFVFYGDHIAGDYTYSDTWEGLDSTGAPTSGYLENAAGDMYGTLQTDGTFDTGFTE